MIPALLYGSVLFSQNIDSLRTDRAVLSFVRSLDKYYKNLYIVPPKPVLGLEDYEARYREFGSEVYEKADFDGNGLTDLLFNGYLTNNEENHDCRRVSFVVLSFGNDSFRVKDIKLGSFTQFFAARKIILGGQNCIATLNSDWGYKDKNVKNIHNRLDTLAYVLDEFIERTKPNMDTIKKIEYCVGGGLGFFQGLKLSITDTISIMGCERSLPDMVSVIDSGGVFRMRTDYVANSRIWGLLRHIDISHLANHYEVPWTDALEGSLTITYNNGTVKQIDDYGLIGTYGLAALQRTLIGVRNLKHWKKIKEYDERTSICDY